MVRLEATTPDLDLLIFARLLHVVAGTFWAGAAILLASFVLPAVNASGAAGAPVMRQLTVVRKLPQFLLATAAVAIASGAYLYWIVSGALQATWLYSWSGSVYTLGALAALMAFSVGIGINIPSANRIGALMAKPHTSGEQPTTEQSKILSKLRLRLARGNRAVAVLVTAATAAMAVARYFP